MIRVTIKITDLYLVMQSYDQIKIYRCATEGGSYTEVTDADTRITIEEELSVYFFLDTEGAATDWYKTTYFNSSNQDESTKSAARQGGTEFEKIGYTFKNYAAPTGDWGKLLTADDMRYTYLWGIDCTASDIAETNFQDEQFDFFIDEALSDFEDFLTIDIRKKVYKTEPAAALLRAPYWREGVDYTDLDDPYPFEPQNWSNFGFVQLRHSPIISVERAILYSQVKTEVIDLLDKNWVRLTKETGQIHLFPTVGYPYGPFALGAMPWRFLGVRFPEGLQFDYTSGYPTSDFVPRGLRAVIGKWGCIKCLQTVGDGLLAGFSSQSVSLDGLSESFSSTQSATSAYFGARIKSYQDEIKIWLEHNRYKHGSIPMSFVGV